ncbi:GFA family protein, partial [Escherichia coli]|uniref:GFA family protein n=1 Tax=Escherichia coli TaxID=562 RepID=UPI00398A9447
KCQKTYGGIFQPMFKFAGEDFRFVKGDLKYYSSSTFAKRGFCVECGSGIVFLYEGNDALYIMTGTLDHPGDWPMTSDAAWGPTIH